MPISSTGAGGLTGAIVVSIAIVGGGGMVAMLDATTSGVGGAGRSSFATSLTAVAGTTGIWWLIALFSGSPASSSRTRRISYAGVSMYLFGTSTTCAPLLVSMPLSQSRFSFIR